MESIENPMFEFLSFAVKCYFLPMERRHLWRFNVGNQTWSVLSGMLLVFNGTFVCQWRNESQVDTYSDDRCISGEGTSQRGVVRSNTGWGIDCAWAMVSMAALIMIRAYFEKARGLS